MADLPTLVVMAAGMGSRFGGIKQLEPITENDEQIIDFTVYDACRAGFDRVIFIINHQIADLFKEKIGSKISRYLQVDYVYQELDCLPHGYVAPEGREKPYGTGHAILSARHLIDGPFLVVNADDYYGLAPFQTMYQFLNGMDDQSLDYAMVTYKLKNTVSPHGSVSRGVCQVSTGNTLVNMVEKTKIIQEAGEMISLENNDKTRQLLSPETLVSMNFWGFNQSLFADLEASFEHFLDHELPANPEKAEFYLNALLNQKIASGERTVHVFSTDEKWYGITYQEDKQAVKDALTQRIDQGMYRKPLWQ